MSFRLTYATMFDPPEELHDRLDVALAKVSAGLGGRHALYVDGRDVRASLKQYKTVEGVVAHASELKGKQKERVEQFGEQAILSKKLATIVTDVAVPWDEEDLVYTGPDAEKLKPILDELEFKTMAPRIFGLLTGAPTPAASVPATQKASQLSMFGSAEPEVGPEKKSIDIKNVSYSLVEKPDEVHTLVQKLKEQKEFSFKVLTNETENFDFEATELVVSFAAREAWFVPLISEKIVADFKEVLESERRPRTATAW